MPRLTPFLWFDTQAEEAAEHYVGIFPNSRILSVSRKGSSGPAMLVTFELDGFRVTALNGGPLFRFSEAVSFVIDCETQADVDHYWDRLSDGGAPGRCGWLKDRFGFSWQVVPTALGRLLGDPDPAASQRVMAAMMQMNKLEIAGLEQAHRA